MFQREVAERIVATPEQRAAYGRLAVLTGWRCEAKILFDVPKSAFVPPPKITSSIVQLIPRQRPEPCDRRLLERITLAAFGQRRKMLRQSLKPVLAEPTPIIEAAGLSPTARAEEVPVSGFVRLANALAEAL
jgi:16S rRNA (adenine1518-N6/adenine1519-N6)-dimethyltransferase